MAKKISLELEGNALFMFFEDAGLNIAIAGAVIRKFKSAGQTCVCSNRIFMQKDIYGEFIRKLKDAVARSDLASIFRRVTGPWSLLLPQRASKA
ncbi:hypothetical protein MCOR25_003603 [Pyricularia grisea]|nr:hypothetical protein MCOR25_003603 [Pyricularia grisea]